MFKTLSVDEILRKHGHATLRLPLYNPNLNPTAIYSLKLKITLNSTIFWDVMWCSLVQVHQHLEEMYCLNLQAQRVSQVRNCNTQAASRAIIGEHVQDCTVLNLRTQPCS
jgi:hypothetical protein